MTRDLDLIKVDVDVIVMVARMRGTHVTDSKGDEASEGADAEDGHEAR